MRALLLARAEGGNDAFDELYRAIGGLVHEDKLKISSDLVRKAAQRAGVEDLLERAVADDAWADRVRAEHDEIRERGAFGVPTISIDGTLPVFGPVFGVAPTGDRAVAAFEHTRWLAEQPEFYELKRFRPARAGEMPEKPASDS